MQKKYWISLAVLAAVVLGAGHFLTDGDWYIVRVLKKEAPGFFTTSEDPVAQAQRQLTNAQKGVVEAKHHLMEARRAVAEAGRQLARARQNEAVSRRAEPEKPAPRYDRFGGIIRDDPAKLTEPEGPRLNKFGDIIPDDPAESISGPRLNRFGGVIIDDDEPVQTARAATAQRPGVVWNRTGRAPLASFQIITSSGADYFVKLVETGTGREAVAIYVQGGTPVKVKVPLGTYTMRYAYGEKWYGPKYLFGPENMTRYSVAQKPFDFKISGDYISNNTVTLIQKTGGNLPTKAISADQF